MYENIEVMYTKQKYVVQKTIVIKILDNILKEIYCDNDSIYKIAYIMSNAKDKENDIREKIELIEQTENNIRLCIYYGNMKRALTLLILMKKKTIELKLYLDKYVI